MATASINVKRTSNKAGRNKLIMSKVEGTIPPSVPFGEAVAAIEKAMLKGNTEIVPKTFTIRFYPNGKSAYTVMAMAMVRP